MSIFSSSPIFKLFRSVPKRLKSSLPATSLYRLLERFPSVAMALQRLRQQYVISRTAAEWLVLRPSATQGEWQLWNMPSKKSSSEKNNPVALSTPQLLEEHAMPAVPSKKHRLIVGVPTRDLLVHPLWVASEGSLQELVELELASKHLLRRGMGEGLKIIPLRQKEGRSLVVVLAPTTTPSPLTAPYLKHASHFEAAARLLPPQGADILIWRELGEICFGFVEQQQLLWFSGSGETEMNSPLLGLIKRMAFHFQAESVLEKMPQSVRLFGDFSKEEHTLLRGSFEELLEEMTETPSHHHRLPLGLASDNEAPGAAGPQPESLPEALEGASTETTPQFRPAVDFSFPVIPKPLLDLPSEQARHVRFLEEKRKRVKKVAALALLLYFFLLVLGGVNLFFKEVFLHHLTRQLAAEEPTINQASHTVATWLEFRGAIDPRAYTLDLLAVIASKMKGEKIRLITLAGGDGKIQITGEAADVSQAYHFMESIKTAPELEEYKWVSDQPKLAGKNNVRFELEGSLPHATTSTE